MKLELYRHLWGFGAADDPALAALAAEGLYAGVECGLPPADGEEAFRDLLQRHRLGLLAMVFTASAGGGPAEHLAVLRSSLARARRLGAVRVNVHSGSDAWDATTAAAFLREAVAMGGDAGMPVVHETHRGCILFHPRLAAGMCERVPGLELCADFSHFAVVCERLPADAELAPLLPRVRHIHARVGHPQGPQVNDPRAPEHQAACAAHERWWDAIWEAQERDGQAVSTLTPEFGPPGYLQTLPYTCCPVADLPAICAWQARRQRERFLRRPAAAAAQVART